MLATDWVEYNARRFAGLPALEDVETGIALTWSDTEERVARYARVLEDQFSITPGDRVVLIAENDIRNFLLQFALMRLRATLVPLNWRLSEAELRAQLDLAHPPLIVHDFFWEKTARSIAGEGTQTLSWNAADTDNIDVLADSAEPLRSRGDEQLDDVALVLFTSGTTGNAKGAQITRSNLVWQTWNISEVNLIHGPGDKALSVLPLFHAGGLNALPVPMLLSGGAVSVVKRFDATQCLELLTDENRRYTHTVVVPIMLKQIADLPKFSAKPWAALKNIQLGGGALAPAVMEVYAAKGVPVQSHYGGTELGPGVSGMSQEMSEFKPGSCGMPFRHTRLRLVEDGRDVEVGSIGEIWLSGPSIAVGYFNEEQSSAFEGDWFRTGDLGRLDADGYLYLIDRLKDIYKSGGENVSPAEVEAVLSEHPAIREVVVFGVPDEKWNETGVAVYVTHDGNPLSREEIVAHCDGRLARFKIPTVLSLVEALPRNVTGKVAKREIRDAYMGQQNPSKESGVDS